MGKKDNNSLESRPPTLNDLLKLCKNLNKNNVKYIVIGGMAIIHHGFVRATEDIDLLVEPSKENEKLLHQALLYLPDKAIKEINPGDFQNYQVIRVADEIVIDLMNSACGMTYKEASNSITMVEIKGVKIPFANLDLLWKLKQSPREKDALDRTFLKEKLSK